MRSWDAIIDDLHKLRERIGRAHGFDVDRIAATIRQHEREADLGPAAKTPRQSKKRITSGRRRAAQHQLEPTAR